MTDRFNCTIFDNITEQEINIVFDYSETDATHEEPADVYFEIISIDGENITHTDTFSEKEIKNAILDYSDSWISEKEEQQEIYEY